MYIEIKNSLFIDKNETPLIHGRNIIKHII